MASSRKSRKPLQSEAGALIKKLRKPLAPPTRVEADENKYSRARERALARRDLDKSK
jgi:hypothetical protein